MVSLRGRLACVDALPNRDLAVRKGEGEGKKEGAEASGLFSVLVGFVLCRCFCLPRPTGVKRLGVHDSSSGGRSDIMKVFA